MHYEPNPKHKPVPQPGRRGSVCPKGVDASALLAASDLVGAKRFATDGLQAFCAQCHDGMRNAWHGYPVGWEEVPPALISQWLAQGLVERRTLRRYRRQQL